MRDCGFFFFKQQTAYELRISDWSSDVCSSDLPPSRASTSSRTSYSSPPASSSPREDATGIASPDGGSRSARKGVGWGKRVSVRVDLGGGRIIKKKEPTKNASILTNTRNTAIIATHSMKPTVHSTIQQRV